MGSRDCTGGRPCRERGNVSQQGTKSGKPPGEEQSPPNPLTRASEKPSRASPAGESLRGGGDHPGSTPREASAAGRSLPNVGLTPGRGFLCAGVAPPVAVSEPVSSSPATPQVPGASSG